MPLRETRVCSANPEKAGADLKAAWQKELFTLEGSVDIKGSFHAIWHFVTIEN